MPKSYPHKGLIAVGGGAVGRRLLEKHKLEHDPVACARTRERAIRDVIAADPGLAVWVGARLYIRENENVLDAIAVGVGLELPAGAKPAAAAPAKRARADRASSPSNAEAAV